MRFLCCFTNKSIIISFNSIIFWKALFIIILYCVFMSITFKTNIVDTSLIKKIKNSNNDTIKNYDF